MISLPPGLLPPDGKGRGKTVPCWGVVQPSELQLEGPVLLLIVGKHGVPLPIQPNPRWYPTDLIEGYGQ